MDGRLKLNLLRHPTRYSDRIRAKELTEEVFNAESLDVSIRPIDMPETTLSYRKELYNKWKEALPSLNTVKSLWIRLKADQDFFEAVCQMRNLESLSITTSAALDLTPLVKLSKLKRLYIDSFSRLNDISSIQNLRQLQTLMISNSFKVENYEIIGQMTQLLALGLHGDEVSPKNLRLYSLKPYNSLKKLQHLDLSVTSVIDNSYDTLLEMENLERFDTVASISKTLRDKIKSHPKLQAGSFVDWDYENRRFYPDTGW